MCVFASQVPVTVAGVSALLKTGGFLENTASVTTGTVTNTTASSALVISEENKDWRCYCYK